jgi:pimeloyl-ACP methyl ester carboxylesterase
MYCIGFYNELPFLPQLRWSRMLRVLALTFLGLGLSIVAGAAQASATSKVHIYLIRGGLNVFSLGMDEIAAKLQRMGLHATVHNHLVWLLLADEAAAEYKSGRVRTIIVVGHSAGAGAVTSMTARLGELGVPVKLAITLDPAFHQTASGRVSHFIDYYVASGIGTAVDRGRQFRGTLQNVDVSKLPRVGHFNIDKNQAIQERVIKEIRAAI